MFRVERISLAADSAIGPVTIGSPTCRLSDFDLVVIQGPNGAGKTSIVQPLCSWSPEATLTWCGDPASKPSEAEARKVQVQVPDWLLCRNSIQLMSEFLSLEAALASVSGIERLREESELLRKLAPDNARAGATHALATLAGTAPPGRSQGVTDAIVRYESAERSAWLASQPLPRDAPLTLGQYNEWGREAAAEIGVAWTDQTVADEKLMRAAEEMVRPQVPVISGANDVKTAARDLAESLGSSPLQDRLERLRTTENEVRTATAELESKLFVTAGGVKTQSLHEQAKACCAELESKASALDLQAKAIDALAKLRSDAVSLLAESIRTTCPVCDSAVARDELLKRLASAPGDASGGAIRGEAMCQLKLAAEIEGLAETWRRRDREHQTAKSIAHSWLASRKADCGAIAKRLMARDGWDEFACKVADDLRIECQHVATTPEPSDISTLQGQIQSLAGTLERLEMACRDTIGLVDAQYARVKARTIRAETIYAYLTLLRPILVSRSALNAEPWHSNRKERDRVEQRELRIKDWEAAVRFLIGEREARIKHASTAILGEPAVQRRFSKLLDAISHPLARNARLEAGRVVSAQGVPITRTGRSAQDASKLSEGLTVLVNVAAFFAVAGHASPHQANKAGWLLLDEPTNALDKTNRNRLAEYLGATTVELVPKQIFITTFEDEFADKLVDAAMQHSDRSILRVKLHEWRGSPIDTPELIAVRQKAAG